MALPTAFLPYMTESVWPVDMQLAIGPVMSAAGKESAGSLCRHRLPDG